MKSYKHEGQFWAESKVNATLNAWALINNLRTFLPDALPCGTVFSGSVWGVIERNPLDGGAESLHRRAI